MKCLPTKTSKGFTLVELMVSVGIFAMMTALLLAKYGNFNQGILLTNLAYDVALTIRNAQSYGINVKSAPGGGKTYSEEFNYPYGVHFTTDDNKHFIFFADADIRPDGKYGDGIYTSSLDAVISTSNIKSSSQIRSICIGESPCDPVVSLDITFRRPDPNAIINGNPANSYAQILLEASDGSQKKVIVRSTGQIAVTN